MRTRKDIALGALLLPIAIGLGACSTVPVAATSEQPVMRQVCAGTAADGDILGPASKVYQVRLEIFLSPTKRQRWNIDASEGSSESFADIHFQPACNGTYVRLTAKGGVLTYYIEEAVAADDGRAINFTVEDRLPLAPGSVTRRAGDVEYRVTIQ